uniref:Uncharacterized protein n=1 Tax=Glyptapanteles flavicoxis TaxID=463051 RepID=B7S8S0_9HYME|nr:hypothetical protein GFP_L1_0160 [Glyptapanteles flavicoxis]
MSNNRMCFFSQYMDSKQSHLSHHQLERDQEIHQNSEAVADDNQHASAYVMPSNDNIEITGDNENNGNEFNNPIADENKEQNRNLNIEEFNLENHNSRFESIYSQPLDSTTTIQDTGKACNNNGNFVAPETEFKQQEPCCSSSGSSSSEDSSADPALRRTSKTLSFVKRKSKIKFFINNNY